MSKPTTVLFVDDDPYVRKILCDFLRNSGLEVLCESSGDAGLEAARNYPEDIDILISDVMMPGITGPQLARELAQTRPSMKVLLISAFPEFTAIPDQSWQFLSKPFPAAVLLRKIREMCPPETATGAQG